MTLFRSDRFRNYMGIPDYLPGSKLERINVKKIKVDLAAQPKILDHKPAEGARKKATKVLHEQ